MLLPQVTVQVQALEMTLNPRPLNSKLRGVGGGGVGG